MKIENYLQVIGATMILFSFFLLFNFTSGYITFVTVGNTHTVPNIFLQSEDGAVFWVWSQLTDNINALRFLTYVFTPFILTLFGGLLVEKKIKLSP